MLLLLPMHGNFKIDTVYFLRYLYVEISFVICFFNSEISPGGTNSNWFDWLSSCLTHCVGYWSNLCVLANVHPCFPKKNHETTPCSRSPLLTIFVVSVTTSIYIHQFRSHSNFQTFIKSTQFTFSLGLSDDAGAFTWKTKEFIWATVRLHDYKTKIWRIFSEWKGWQIDGFIIDWEKDFIAASGSKQHTNP